MASKFTKELRKLTDRPLSNLQLKRWRTKSLKAADLLDASNEKLKETLEEASRNFYYIHQHPEDAHTASYKFMEKVEQALKELK